MIGVQELLVAVANTPVDTPVVVDVANNGQALMTVSSVEIKDGRLVIACTVPKSAAKPEKPKSGGKKSENVPAETPATDANAAEPRGVPHADIDPKPEAIELK